MKTTFLNTAEDLAWACERHNVPRTARAVVLYGNEDCPVRIDCYLDAEPRHDAEPFARVVFDAETEVMRVEFASLYDELVAAGVEVRGRESDLTFKVDDETCDILKKWTAEKSLAQTFVSQDPADRRALLFEVPFAFMPYWRKLVRGSPADPMTIRAYRVAGGGWAFDDQTRGLRHEALIAGADELLNGLAAEFSAYSLKPFSPSQIDIRFSSRPFFAGDHPVIVKRENGVGACCEYADVPVEDGGRMRYQFILCRDDEAANQVEPTRDAPQGVVVTGGRGTWYTLADSRTAVKRLWLCPALLRYFREPPERIFAAFRPVGEEKETS